MYLEHKAQKRRRESERPTIKPTSELLDWRSSEKETESETKTGLILIKKTNKFDLILNTSDLLM